ncbi:hypothetical protein T12_16371 [Trichinella patagoniensis]|uniref:Uncharacterized protein n=1 Tax=Trichinella patagoniensis TaxID=990121 RepID=A0A0V0XNI4_9BILA|nr:hypothetical protein T12_16371 [Trichinella patagoniensis]
MILNQNCPHFITKLNYNNNSATDFSSYLTL